jgi:hypothetical protein
MRVRCVVRPRLRNAPERPIMAVVALAGAAKMTHPVTGSVTCQDGPVCWST